MGAGTAPMLSFRSFLSWPLPLQGPGPWDQGPRQVWEGLRRSSLQQRVWGCSDIGVMD